MTDATPHRAYLDRLPVGDRPEVDADRLGVSSIFPFEAEGLRARVLEPPVLPEPPRKGEDGSGDCGACRHGEEQAIWADDDWILLPLREPSAVPVVVTLNPRAHHDLEDLPAALAADLGPLLQRLERAVMAVPGTGRAHLHKWGDGGAHLHVFAFARPLGMLQLRGSCLVLWDDLLPVLDHETWQSNLATVAASMATEGGQVRT